MWCGGKKLCHLLHLTSQNVMNDCTFQITKTNIYLSIYLELNTEHHTARHLLFIYSVASDEMRAGGATVGWAEQQQVALHRVSTRNIYTVYTIHTSAAHRQVWPELAH